MLSSVQLFKLIYGPEELKRGRLVARADCLDCEGGGVVEGDGCQCLEPTPTFLAASSAATEKPESD